MFLWLAGHAERQWSCTCGPLTRGTLRRWRLRPSYWKRALSLIHSSFTASFCTGTMRITCTAYGGHMFMWGGINRQRMWNEG